MRSFRVLAIVGATGLAFAVGTSPAGASGSAATSASASASGVEQITSYDVDLQLRADGTLHVVESIDYDFADLSKHGIYRTIPTTIDYDSKYERRYPISHIAVSGSPGTPTKFKAKNDNRQQGHQGRRPGQDDHWSAQLHDHLRRGWGRDPVRRSRRTELECGGH